MRRLSPREQRFAALLLLVAVVAFAWLLIVQPVLNGFADRAEQRRALQLTYARDERLIGQLPSVARVADAQRRDGPRFHVVAADVPAATAALTEHVGRVLAAAGCEVQSVEDMAATPGLVHARVECRAAPAQIGALLQQVENSTPLLIVDALTIGANRDPQEAGSDLLDIRIDVSASPSAAAPR